MLTSIVDVIKEIRQLQNKLESLWEDNDIEFLPPIAETHARHAMATLEQVVQQFQLADYFSMRNW